MKITNHSNLPEAIVRAVTAQKYNKGKADFSISELIRPPQINQLTREHDAELSEDAADRIWALLGTSIHNILDASRSASEAGEKRLYCQMEGRVISGKFDNLAVTDGILTDYKVTSAYAVKGEPKAEWVEQLNYYAYLAERNGITVNSLQIIAILRDWSRANRLRDPGYPERNVVVVPVPYWSPISTAEAMIGRIREQVDALDGNARPCTDEERWMKPGKVALMKKGRKSAVKLYDTVDEAKLAIKGYDDNHCIEERPAAYPRCENYCPVADYCDQWKGENA